MSNIEHTPPLQYSGVSSDFHTAVSALDQFQPEYSNGLNTKHKSASLFTNDFEVIDPSRYDGWFGWILQLIDMISKGSTDSLDVATKLNQVFSDRTIEKVKTHLVGDDDTDDHSKKMTTTKLDTLISRVEALQASLSKKHKNPTDGRKAEQLFNQITTKLRTLKAELPKVQMENYKRNNPTVNPETLSPKERTKLAVENHDLKGFLQASMEEIARG